MGIKIIDNKKVEMTEDEWLMYKNICQSYNRNNFKGEDLFKNLFETDDSGLIIFLKPPSDRHTSMEVCLFISILMNHQHLRLMHKEVSFLCDSLKEKIKILDEKLKCFDQKQQ